MQLATRSPRSPQAEREVRRDSALRRARSCYDHLAGVAGVTLFEELIRRGWIALEPGASAADHPPCVLTESGRAALTRLGVAVDDALGAKRAVAYACLDWTERRPHLAGALGAAVLAALERDGVAVRERGRALRLTSLLADWLDASVRGQTRSTR
ncbi:MAG TPA: hypothetical protein VFI42_04120 [Thermomicrobiaceae bacterium]|nr:hypothetical protein [Thermomicrobiaceae bacterium]